MLITTYTRQDKSVIAHQILNYDEAWKLSDNMCAQNYRENGILKSLAEKWIHQVKSLKGRMDIIPSGFLFYSGTDNGE